MKSGYCSLFYRVCVDLFGLGEFMFLFLGWFLRFLLFGYFWVQIQTTLEYPYTLLENNEMVKL
jgi:hypothetical protein